MACLRLQINYKSKVIYMKTQEIKDQLTNVFRKVFADASLELTNDMTANSIDQWDSLTHMVLITAVETEFAIKFKLKDLNKMRNVGDMIAMVLTKTEADPQ